jgi:hypothetical protein
MSPTGDDPRETGAEGVPDPAAEYAFRVQVDRVEQEKQLARAAPDVPWRTWWFHSGSKWYLVIAFLVLDVWILDYVYLTGLVLILGAVFVLALYGEFLLYRCLYYVPPEDAAVTGTRFRRTWYRPVEYGRWTPQGEVVRAGGTVAPPEAGPDPKEFM